MAKCGRSCRVESGCDGTAKKPSNALPAQAEEVSAEAKAGVKTALDKMGCGIGDKSKVEAYGDGYKVQPVECIEGDYEVT